MMRYFSALRVRLMLLVGFAVLATLALAVRADLQYRKVIVADVQDNALSIAKLVALDQERLILGTAQLLAALSRLATIQSGSPAACTPILRGLLKPDVRYHNFGITNLNGDVLASAVPMRPGTNWGNGVWFNECLRRKDFSVGDYQVGRVTGRPSIHVGSPVRDSSGQVVRLVYCAINPDWISQLSGRTELPQGATLTVTDRSGVVLGRVPDPEQWVGKSAADWQLFQDSLSQQQEGTARTVGLDRVRRLYSFTTVQAGGAAVHVVVGWPEEHAFAELDRITTQTLLWFVAVAVLVLVLTSLGGHLLIMRPIGGILAATRRLAKSDLTARTGMAHASGELGELANAFDTMAAALQRDVHDIRRAEDALRRENVFVNTVLETLGALVVILDCEGQIINFNKACEQTTGYTLAEVKGRKYYEFLLAPEEAEGVREVFQSIQAGQFPNQNENYWLDKAGRRRLIAWSNSAVLAESGEVEYIVGTGIEITSQRALEDSLRLDEMRLKALLQLSEMTDATLREITDFALEEAVRLTNSTIGYLAFTSEDETVLTMHSWSKTAMAHCSMIDKPIVYPVESTGLWGEAIRQRRPLITNDYTAPSSLKRGYPEGHVPVTRHMNIPVFDGEHIVAVAGVGNKTEEYNESDVLQLQLLMNSMWRLLHRRQAAEELQRAHDELEQRVILRTAELARSNSELERFGYVASHDLQEPLRKITAFGQRLEQKLGENLDPDARDYLARMQNASMRMQVLINDLLAYSRVTTQAQPFVPTDLNDVVAEVLSDLEIRIEENAAEVEVSDLPVVEVDTMQMRQLFQNLISNALKFRRPDTTPKVTIQAEPLAEISETEHAPGIRITVQDNGIGFDDKYADRIFGVFQRLHTREEYPGTGIGLAICRKIAERHGGTITAHSGADAGATFQIDLPVRHAGGEAADG